MNIYSHAHAHDPSVQHKDMLSLFFVKLNSKIQYCNKMQKKHTHPQISATVDGAMNEIFVKSLLELLSALSIVI